MIINLTYENSTPQSFKDGMTTAVNMLDAAITNNITVNISVGYGTFGGSTLESLGFNQNTSLGNIGYVQGGTNGQGVNENYADLRSLLANHETSSEDTSSVNALPTGTSIDGHGSFTIGTAQGKALGVTSATATAIDGQIGMGTNFTGDNLIAGALHEITHAMGRIAGLSVDLFRFNENGTNTRVYGFGIPATAAYFSFDGGTTKTADFGISSDPGDFLNGGVQGTDPFNEIVGGNKLTQVDCQIMDVLGFNIDYSAPNEPKSTLPVGLGGTVTITSAFLLSYDSDNAPDQVIYTVPIAPQHGTLLLNGNPTARFTQADIDNGLVQYQENGDVVASDTFAFVVTDPAGNSTPNEAFKIAVVNTTAPVIATNNTLPVALGGSSLLTGRLSTVSLGENPGQVVYTVLSGPSHGTLLLDGQAATSFTQADIDNYRVQYVDDGSLAGSDSFVFQAANASGEQTAATTFDISIAAAAPATLIEQVFHDSLGRAPTADELQAWTRALTDGLPIKNISGALARSPDAAALAQIYNDVLGRSPDAAGLSDWAVALQNGSNLTSVRESLAGSAEAQNDVTQLYAQILGRAPDSGGLAYWMGALNSVTLQDERSAFANSGEAQNDLTQLYNQALGRGPDATELTSWTNALSAGVPLQDVATAFAISPSATALAQLYNDVLGRSPDAGGLISWAQSLAAGASLHDVRTGFAYSAEGQSDLTKLYNDVLGRAPDAGGLASWTNSLANGASLAAARAGFAQSPEAQGDLTQIYDQVLNRAPDAAGLSQLTGALAGGSSLSDARSSLAHTAEAQGDLASLFQTVEGRAPDTAELAGLENQLALSGVSLSSIQTGLAAGGTTGALLIVVPNGSQNVVASSGPEAFDFSSWSTGSDSIVGFDPTQDAVRLSYKAGASVAGLQAAMTSSAGGTVIALDGQRTLSLVDVAPGALSAANFRFV